MNITTEPKTTIILDGDELHALKVVISKLSGHIELQMGLSKSQKNFTDEMHTALSEDTNQQ